MVALITAEGLVERVSSPAGRVLADGVVQLCVDASGLIAAEIFTGDVSERPVSRVEVLGDHRRPRAGRLQHILVLDALLDAQLVGALGALGVVEGVEVEEDGVQVDVVHTHAAVAPAVGGGRVRAVLLRTDGDDQRGQDESELHGWR